MVNDTDILVVSRIGGNATRVAPRCLMMYSGAQPGGSPLVERETTKLDNWPLELGPHLTTAETQKA